MNVFAVMKKILFGKHLLWALILLNVSSLCHGVGNLSETEMQDALNAYNVEASDLLRKVELAEWDVATDVGNQIKETEKERRIIEYTQYKMEKWNKTWANADINQYKNETIRRQLFFLNQLDESALALNRLINHTKTITAMKNVYNTAKICPFNKQTCNTTTEGLTLDPEISQRFAESRDVDELQYLWTSWHSAIGQRVRSHYRNYVGTMNEMAVANHYVDAGEAWRADYEDPHFIENIDRLWSEVKPLYDELHTYVKFNLHDIYGDKVNPLHPTMPAHLLGNVWAQTWQNLFNDTRPFKNVTLIDVTPMLLQQNMTVRDMFEKADDFFTSLGLPTNNMSYTGPSIIEKPTNRTIQCHASAWDFSDGKDFRIKMCTSINMEDFLVIHHEMGHIQYFIQYKDLPLPLRSGANPAFHETIGDTIALSVATKQHLHRVGLLESYADTMEDNINALYWEALSRVAFLPFGLIVDKWRWDVFNGTVPEERWNEHWWHLREEYQKVSPPIVRNETDFDPGAKFHVVANVPYISYFISHLMQFQFYRSLCIEAKQYDPNNSTGQPLHKCDFYQSKEAGEKLADLLKLGASKHWSHAMKMMINETDVSANALLEYFKPLHEFLIAENKRRKDEIMRPILVEYNKAAAVQCNKLKLAEWDKVTDLNNEEKRKAYVQAVKDHAKFVKDLYDQHFSGLKPSDFADEKIQRQIRFLTNIGQNALNVSRLTELTQTKNEMQNIYNNAEFCDYKITNCTKKLTLEPEIMEIMSNSNDYDRLKYIWLMWHNSTGPLIRPHYKKYIEISNEAAKLNNFTDYGDMWRSSYEDPKFLANVRKIWEQVQPLYDALHEYTRHKLLKIYGDKMDANDPLIPAHLLGNMWAQTWDSLFNRIKPFDSASDINIDKGLQANNYTALKIFQESDSFYKSLGLESSEMSYTGLSIIEKPANRTIVCHAQAWDFCDGEDFRIKQCTSVNTKHFVTAHHEMGHIQYYILYKDQPVTFRAGANPAFHEAVGDLIALSVSTPKHLKKINLLQNYENTYENQINSLFKMALQRVAFLPFGLLIDLYRYDLFNGTIPEKHWNQHYEMLREKYQKIRSPGKRTEVHFDAGAKFHVPSDIQYVSYFLAHILEFQMLRSTCEAAGQYDPHTPGKALHECDIAGSTDAGTRLRDGLSLGRSKHWSEALKRITNGDTEIKADALLEYFRPLHDFLVCENEKMRKTGGSKWYVMAGIAVAVALIALISYAIYYVNKR